MNSSHLTLFILLFVAFLDFMGVGLVFPLFVTLFFDPNIPFLAAETSAPIRGMWMGILLALSPLVQFFVSPILGSISDQKGRKSVMLFGLGLGFIAYLIGILSLKIYSLSLLIVFRSLFGVSASTMPVVQAALSDISTPNTKARYFALYSMAIGLGFTIGPYLGGILSDSSLVSWFGYSTIFFLGAILTMCNWLCLLWKFKESREVNEKKPIEIFRGIRQAKRAFTHPQLRFVFLSFFLYLFGWEFFFSFISVVLKNSFAFSTMQIGNFFGYSGLMYALSTGLLIRPFLKRLPLTTLLSIAMLGGGAFMLLFLLIKAPFYFWFFLPIMNFLSALYYPVATTYITEDVGEEAQGERLGIFYSILALALLLNPLLAGSFVGAMPKIVIYLSGSLMLIGGVVFQVFRNYAHRLDEEG